METTYRSQASTSVLIPNRFDTKQRNNTQHNDAPPEIPPSPTLTNPDMILPDDGERQSSTPSPPFQLTPSDPQMLQNGLQQNGYYPSNGSNYRAPRPRWTYDGHAHGRPLSDIGEEDFQPSSPAYAGRYTAQPQQEKSDSDSVGSGSTISAGSQRQLNSSPEGVRGGNDSGFNSRRSSYASQSSIDRERAQAGDALVSGSSQQTEEESSSTILSSEAERILENAKRRLTVSRARSYTRA
jgi:hypothetical protein